MKRSRGIALIQVLLISAIISVLALYLSKSAREQIAMAQLSNDRAEALLMLHSAQAEVLVALLTHYREQDPNARELLPRRWNFYNQPFKWQEGVEVRIQDQSGLISVQFPEASLVKQMYRQLGYDTAQASGFIDRLLDWQDADRLTRLNGAESGEYETGPRDGGITLKSELTKIKGFGLWQQLSPSFTLYRRGPFNPTTSTYEILAGLVGVDDANEVMAARKSGFLTPARFSQITGLSENDNTIFYPGKVLEVTLTSTKHGLTLKKSLMLHLEPYAQGRQAPVDFLEVHW